MKMVPMRWPEELIRRIDRAARRIGTSRSDYVRNAAVERLRKDGEACDHGGECEACVPGTREAVT